MSDRSLRRTHLLVYGLIALVVLVGVAFLASRRDRTIPLGTAARFDDFAFAVVDARRLDEIDGLRPRRGVFLVVRLGIRNQAKRVDYQFHAETTSIEDADHARFPIDAEATNRLAASPQGLPACDRPVSVGKSCTTDLVFDVPKEIHSARIRLWSGPIVDILDGLFSGGRASFALDSEGP